MQPFIRILILILGGIGGAQSRYNVELLQYTVSFVNSANRYLSEFFDAHQDIDWMTEIYGIKEENLKISAKLESDFKTYIKNLNEVLVKIDDNVIDDNSLRRQLKKIPRLDYDVLKADDLNELNNVIAGMTDIYKTVNLCSYQDRNMCNLTLIPHVQNIIHKTTDIKEIEYYWLEWRMKTGSLIREKFQRFIELYRKVSRLNGYEKPSDYWFRELEEDTFIMQSDLEIVMSSVRPVLLEMHAFIRDVMLRKYGTDVVSSTDAYPSHLSEIFIGRAFRMTDASLIELPFSSKPLYNLTLRMPNVGLKTTKDLFTFVDEYFSSLGFESFSEHFWVQYSAPKHNVDETHLICLNKVWEFHALPESRVSYCPHVDQTRFYNMFETVSELHYTRSYKLQPFLFQNELFPNFKTSLGKLFSLAASSPKYLERIGLITNEETKLEYRINRLYFMALQNVLVLPIYQILDKFRVDILDGKKHVNDNCAYWSLVENYIGAAPPFIRNKTDFDAPSHLIESVDVEYSTQIVGTIIQFQLFKVLCEKSGQYVKGDRFKPLDMCDLYGEKEVFYRIRRLMKSGCSKTWREMLLEITGEIELNPDGFVEYFEPLNQWLKDTNTKKNLFIGWGSSQRCQR